MHVMSVTVMQNVIQQGLMDSDVYAMAVMKEMEDLAKVGPTFCLSLSVCRSVCLSVRPSNAQCIPVGLGMCARGLKGMDRSSNVGHNY